MRSLLLCAVVVFLSLQFGFAQVDVIGQDETTAKVKFIKQSATFEEKEIDFGKMTRGETKETEFIFINSGMENLEIELVSACECTTLDWTRGPIAPKKEGKISVKFDSTEKKESGTVDVDVYFKPIEGTTEDPLFEILSFSFELE